MSEHQQKHQPIIQNIDYPVETGRDLLNNEILLLKPKEPNDDLRKKENEYENDLEIIQRRMIRFQKTRESLFSEDGEEMKVRTMDLKKS